MNDDHPKSITAQEYEEAAYAYQSRLTLENKSESTSQADQRYSTLSSLCRLRKLRCDFYLFNELLVQYPRLGGSADGKRIGQVLPDNMVVLSKTRVEPDICYNVDEVPVPLVVMEYIANKSRRKDYAAQRAICETELKVPYHLRIFSDRRELVLDRMLGGEYHPVPSDARGRKSIPELEIEFAMVGNSIRYWHRGELLMLPEEMQSAISAAGEYESAVADFDKALSEVKGALDNGDKHPKDKRDSFAERLLLANERMIRCKAEFDRRLRPLG